MAQAWGNHRDVVANLELVHLDGGAHLRQVIPLGREAHADHMGGAHGEGRLERQVLDHAAVHEGAAVQRLGTEQPWYGYGRAYRLDERAVVDENGLLGGDIRGNGGEANGHVLDHRVMADAIDGLAQALRVEQSEAGSHREGAEVSP